MLAPGHRLIDAQSLVVAVGGREAVQRPRQAARPGRFGCPALMRALPEEGAGAGVEEALVCRAAVGPDQVTGRRSAVLHANLSKRLVAGGAGGPEDDAD